MSSIFAMTQDAVRRAEEMSYRCSSKEMKRESEKLRITDYLKGKEEIVLLLVILLLLYKRGANAILLLAIMYVMI